MTRNERQAMWQERIDAFKASEESSVTAWCAANDIPVQSMYAWLKKDRLKQLSPGTSTQWVMLESLETNPATHLTLKLGAVSIEVKQGFNPILLSEVLQVLQADAK